MGLESPVDQGKAAGCAALCLVLYPWLLTIEVKGTEVYSGVEFVKVSKGSVAQPVLMLQVSVVLEAPVMLVIR